ncbi:MAG: 50S ribosomal protein L15 [Candidatus Omnitrophota bacterium]|nr:50S ribosomal protein L15 [Candidatus Omnitrophota bacterium]
MLARKRKKRRGRGIGSGHGKTSCRGHKGQKARSGGGVRLGFEGGQMPLSRRIPKRGFTSLFKKEYQLVNLYKLRHFDKNAAVTPDELKKLKIIKRIGDGVKILGQGEISNPLTIKAHVFSKGAKEKIEKAGGKTEIITRKKVGSKQ